jgi:hypothetical protein
MVQSQCQTCGSTGLRAHYQHISTNPPINHQWDEIPSVGPSPTSAPHPTPCPNDGPPPGPFIVTYKAVYTKCPCCGLVQTAWPAV